MTRTAGRLWCAWVAKKRRASTTPTYVYDGVGRISTRTLKNGTTDTAVTTYSYVPGRPGVTGSTTPLVAGIAQPGVSFDYEYDSRGNITKETRTPQGGAAQELTYSYDSLGQLTRVNDLTDTTAGATGTTWVYAYDLGGNIQSKTRYAYTTDTPDTAQQTIAYGYGDANWKDKLTSYDGTAITYNAIGNVTDDGTWTYTWRAGRQLAGMAKKGTAESYEFRYNEEGLRVQKIKKVGDVVTETTDYTLHGKLVAHLKKGADNLHFFYDSLSRPAMVDFNGTTYHYIHNLQGDIVRIVDNVGTLAVEYNYGAWGRLLGTTGPLKAILGALNPFCYRGYVYDVETGFYYLRSRHYNPVLARFVCADEIYELEGDVFEYNIYCYSNNSPIVYKDTEGTFALLASLGAAIGIAVVVAAAIVVTAAIVAAAILVTEVVEDVGDELKKTVDTAAAVVSSVYLASKVDPYARPGQKKQGGELRKKRKRTLIEKIAETSPKSHLRSMHPHVNTG